jgi:hypothetical protein
VLNHLKHKVKEAIYKVIPPPHTNESFSQAGEDCIIEFLLNDIGIQKITYLELGVYQPIIGSNTYRLYQRGCRGVLVEADSTLIENIKKYRPEDKVIHGGVGFGEESVQEFFIFEMPAHNTFDKKEAEYREKHGSYKLKRIDKVLLKPINKIIEQYFRDSFPEFLSIDIEGLDLNVLKSINYEKYPIPIICAETCKYSENHIRPKDRSIEEFMLSKGYFIYADTYINTIFVNEKWFNSYNAKK